VKKIFFGFLASYSLLLSQAYAQNDCCPSQYNSCCDQATFDGFYLGGNLGIITHTAHRNDRDGFLTDNSGWTTNDTNFTIGVQLGYDWVCDCKLLGLVVDWNWADNNKTLRDNPNAVGSDNFIRSSLDWFTTIRARAGLTVCDALVYVTGGAAVTSFDTTWNESPDKFKAHDTKWGWTGGFGAEFLVWCNWSLGAEVLFMQFSEREETFTSTTATDFEFGHSDSAWVGRIVLNYRFGDLCGWCCR